MWLISIGFLLALIHPTIFSPTATSKDAHLIGTDEHIEELIREMNAPFPDSSQR